jgi:diguanylate cyclase (GGDEF)-like protein
MRARFIRSSYVLSAVAVAWVAGIVLLHFAYVRPYLARQVERIGSEKAANWLRLTNAFLHNRQAEILQITSAWAEDDRIRGRLAESAVGAGPAGLTAPGQQVSVVLLCDSDGRVRSAWRVGANRRLTLHPVIEPGTDLSRLPLFRQSPEADEAAGVSPGPEGISLFARCAIRTRPEGDPQAYLVSLGPVDQMLLAEMSAMVGADVRFVHQLTIPAGATSLGHGQIVWDRAEPHLNCAQILFDQSSRPMGYFLVHGQTQSTYAQARMTRKAMTATLVWGVLFAVLMILIIHLLVSGPMWQLWRRVQDIRSGRQNLPLVQNLRGEALGLAREFEQVLANVEKLSQTDPLTELSNRRVFQQFFEQEFRRSRRYGRPMALVTMDIDFFKAINDTLGHASGDETICMFADVVRESVRAADTAARLGGDEFSVLMPETTGAEADIVAQRLRENLAGRSVGKGVIKMSLTTSIGIVDLNTPGADTPEAMFDLADQALYAAKRAGRNRTVHAVEVDQLEEVESGPDQKRVDHLCRQLAGMDAKFKRLFVDSIGGLISALEARDVFTAHHSAKVRRYATLIAEQMQLPSSTIERIGRAAMLHDIGKIGLPDKLLLKDGPLTEEEWDLMRRHPLISVGIMESMEFLDQEVPTVRYHHEHFDGSGYPEGLAGSQIPLAARVLAVADAFDAMTSSRAYREAMSVQQACEELGRGRGKQFDPDVVDAFLVVIRDQNITDESLAVPAAAAS